MGLTGQLDVRPAPPPILTAHLFAEVDDALLELMESLTAEEWRRPTTSPKWNVRQVAAHLLDTALRRLSFGRDGWRLETGAITPDRELVALIDRLNAQGVAVLGALSPRVLTDLTAVAVRGLRDYLQSLESDGDGHARRELGGGAAVAGLVRRRA